MSLKGNHPPYMGLIFSMTKKGKLRSSSYRVAVNWLKLSKIATLKDHSLEIITNNSSLVQSTSIPNN